MNDSLLEAVRYVIVPQAWSVILLSAFACFLMIMDAELGPPTPIVDAPPGPRKHEFVSEFLRH